MRKILLLMVLVWYVPNRCSPAVGRMESELMVEAVDVPVLLPPVQVAAVASGSGADAGNYAHRRGVVRPADGFSSGDAKPDPGAEPHQRPAIGKKRRQ